MSEKIFLDTFLQKFWFCGPLNPLEFPVTLHAGVVDIFWNFTFEKYLKDNQKPYFKGTQLF